ncbi:ROK family protein [Calidifontibacillus erzurumensis]|uniref:ROK family protein n=1 Tax=Calidifontibacillus erzurumensis TaxID=2741433 RepID=UPI0035B54B79
MGQTTWNQQVVKKKNKQLVLSTILAFAPISRAEIASQLGLNKATVSSLVNELLDEELIYESGPGESSGGRRPVMLLFNERAGYAIGVDIGVNYILGIVTDLTGTIVYEEKRNLQKVEYQELISIIHEMIAHLIENVPPSRYGVVGIGIGVPGIVDKNGKVLLAPNLRWKDVDLLNKLKERFHYPILIENEANAGAYGEKKFGLGQDFSNIIYVSAGIGIGVGIILNHDLYRGFHGYAGESGHMTIVADGEKCTCGSTGCWEAYASEHALLQQAKQNKRLANKSLDELMKLAEKQDKDTIELFQKIGTYLGIGISNLIKTFNPQQIIIGNTLANAEKWIEKPMMESVKKQTLFFYWNDLAIDFSKLSTHSTALGVAAFVIEEFLKTDQTENNASLN